jgi:transcriptional regulator with XRE-family HTH domain
MANRDAPSSRERQLANSLKRFRITAGLSGKEAAERLGWSASKVSRLEGGRSGISEDDLDRLLELYRVTDEQAVDTRRLAASTQSMDQSRWWEGYADSLSPEYTNLIKLETGSRALQCYCAVVPHALLQTAEYARYVISSTLQRPSPAEVDRRVDVHYRRQILVRGAAAPLRLNAIVDEAVIRRKITRPDGQVDVTTMRTQFEWLIESAGRPNVTIRVLPFDAGLPPVTAGSFTVLESASRKVPDVVYLENKTRVVFIDTESEVYWYTQDFELLSKMSLNSDESLELIRQAIAEL